MSKDDSTDGSTGSDSGNTQANTGGHLGEIPKVDFSTFVLSIGTTALYQMGLVADPSSGETTAADSLVAQQTIDTLEMIREKTVGNLTDEERKLIDSLLYELRIKFVELSR